MYGVDGSNTILCITRSVPNTNSSYYNTFIAQKDYTPNHMLILKPKNTFKQIFSSLQLCSHSSDTHQSTTPTHQFLNFFFRKSISNLKSLLQSHSLVITTGHSNNIYLASKLISLYASFNKPNLSTQVFNSLQIKDTFLYNSIIKAHFSNGLFSQALEFHLQMRVSGCPANHFTIPMVASSSAELFSIEHGKNLHGLCLKVDLFAGSSAVGSSLVYMYVKCGELGEAFKVFGEMPIRDVVSWTAIIVGCVHNGESEKGLVFLREMHNSGEDSEKPNFRTIEGGLQGCGNLNGLLEGRCLHGFAVKTGIGCSCFVQSALLSMYSKCNSGEEARLAFCELPNKDIISWTTILGVYARSGYIAGCLELFWAMQASGISPDGIVIGYLLTSFATYGLFLEGKAFHGLILRKNLQFDVSVGNSLLLMYCKFERLGLAEKIFDRMPVRDVESWNLMVFGYGKIGMEVRCIELFREMQFVGLESDISSFVTVISSCSRLVALHLGRSIHCYVIKAAIEDNVSIANSLLGMYGRCGNLRISRSLFHKTERDLVTWNSLIAVYARNGHSSDALALFDQMLLEEVKPNSATLLSVLSACSHLAALNRGEQLHNYIKEMGLDCDVSLGTALVDMYTKCGRLEKSREIFDSLPERDIIAWNVMISGYGIHGNAKDAIEIFRKMEESGVTPNGVTFLAVLSACSHAGLVDEGKDLYGRMKDYSVVPTLKHYACMVDLLGRSGNLYEAEAMVLSMPISPDGGVWGSLLGACKLHNNVEMGERVAIQALESDPENDGYYILMSNLYSSVGRWEDAERVRGMMKLKGVNKKVGWSAM